MNWRTLYLNFKYLSLKDAIRFPILVSSNCQLKLVGGNVSIVGEIRTGMILIGIGDVGIFDERKQRSIWQVEGNIIFKGSASFGHGSRISVGKTGTIIVGDKFAITGASSIVCHKKISLGNRTTISWEVLLMDTDFHKIKNEDGVIINPAREIIIEDDVWIGCRATILKGVKIESGNVVAAGSILTKSILGKNQIIGGNPPRIIKEKISWEL